MYFKSSLFALALASSSLSFAAPVNALAGNYRFDCVYGGYNENKLSVTLNGRQATVSVDGKRHAVDNYYVSNPYQSLFGQRVGVLFTWNALGLPALADHTVDNRLKGWDSLDLEVHFNTATNQLGTGAEGIVTLHRVERGFFRGGTIKNARTRSSCSVSRI